VALYFPNIGEIRPRKGQGMGAVGYMPCNYFMVGPFHEAVKTPVWSYGVGSGEFLLLVCPAISFLNRKAKSGVREIVVKGFVQGRMKPPQTCAIVEI